MAQEVPYPPVVDLDVTSKTSVAELLEQFEKVGGFTSAKLSKAAEILANMVSSEETFVFFSFPAALAATGCRGILKEFVKRKWVDCVITTCGTLDHDIARAYADYHAGDFDMDDVQLLDEGIHRLGNVLVPLGSYGPLLEKKLQPIFQELYDQGIVAPSTRELCWEIGKRISDEGSLLHWAARNEVPIFVPGIVDGAVGSQYWQFYQDHRDVSIDLLKDQQELSDIIFEAERTGAFMIGGGISKHHTLWWNQFRGGMDFSVYITTASEYDGSLSGARVKEAVSWGKVKKDASFVTVDGEASILLPLLFCKLASDLGA